MTAAPESRRISPTAYYTGHVWYRNGLSLKPFYTLRGQALYGLLQPLTLAMSLRNRGSSLEQVLLQRHRLIDHLLQTCIEERGIRNIVEIASGLSPRGHRFRKAYGDRIRYVEADLPGMAARKRRILTPIGEAHLVADIDATAEAGPLSTRQALEPMLAGGPAVVITEGLLHYLPRHTVLAVWGNIRRFLAPRRGIYLANILLRSETPEGFFSRGFQGVVNAFTRGRTHLHFEDRAEAVEALREAGFDGARVHNASAYERELGLREGEGSRLLNILEASV